MRATVLLTIGFALLLAPPCTAQDSRPAAPAVKPISQMNEDELIQAAVRLRDAGQYVQSLQVLTYLLSKNDRNLEALLLDGEINMMLTPAQAEAARKSFLAARKIQPADFRANFGLGKVNFQSRQWRQAQIYLETAQKAAPSDRLAELYAMLAQCFRANGQLDEAFDAVAKALAADPSSRDAYEVKIALLTGANRFDEALTEASALVELSRNIVRTSPDKQKALIDLHGAHNIRLSVLQELGKRLYQRTPDGRLTDSVIEGGKHKAADVTRQVIDDYVALNDLNHTIQFFTIISFSERLVSMTPDDPQAWLTLGQLYRNTYQDQAAANVMARVLQLDPNNATAKRELESLPPPVSPATQPTTQSSPETADAPVSPAEPATP